MTILKNLPLEEIEVAFNDLTLHDDDLLQLTEPGYEDELIGEISSFLYQNNQHYRNIIHEISKLHDDIEKLSNDDSKQPSLVRVRIRINVRKIEQLDERLDKMIDYVR